VLVFSSKTTLKSYQTQPPRYQISCQYSIIKYRYIIDIIWHLKWGTHGGNEVWGLTVIKLIFNGLHFIFLYFPFSHLHPLNQTKNSEREKHKEQHMHTSSENTLALTKPSVIMHYRIWNIANIKMNGESHMLIQKQLFPTNKKLPTKTLNI